MIAQQKANGLIVSMFVVVNLVVMLGFAQVGQSQVTYEELHAFTQDGSTPSAGLVQASNGNLYGTTQNGGRFGVGTVYKITTGGSLTLLHSFDCNNTADGCNPAAGLIQASDGNLYGTTQNGGTFNAGTVYKITTGGSFTLLHSFDCNSATDGCVPTAGLIQASDGNLYGTTQSGGTFSQGTIYKITTGGAFTLLHSFDCNSATDGCIPQAGLIQANDTNLYGTTQQGGAFGQGTVYKITTGGAFTPLHSFDCSTEGCAPFARLIQASDGNLYGTTQGGGTFNGGTVFKITTGGASTLLHSFDCSSADGCLPLAGLIQASDTNLYGTTLNGGTFGGGTVFKITTGGAFAPLHSFDCSTDGCQPTAGLIQASDGNLYGTTQVGGASSAQGTAYKITTGGSFTVLFVFGLEPWNSAAGLIQASDGNFYGTTQSGGAFGLGTVYKVTTGGIFTLLHSFDCSVDGCFPVGRLMQASDGNLYGTTPNGGAFGGGTVYKITTGGSFTLLHSFDCNNTADGCSPFAEGLIQASDSNLYGTTQSGGAFNRGTVYKITTGGAFTLLYSFDCTTTSSCQPLAGVIQASDGNLYGTTQGGGTFGGGTVFKITTGGAFTPLQSFDCSTDGCQLAAGLIQASDGNLYGTTQLGGAFGVGTAYKITTGGAFTSLHSFDCSTDGCQPFAGLIQASDGNLYGTTPIGRAKGGGVVYRLITMAAVLSDFFLHGTGPTTNPSTLFLDGNTPTGTTAKSKDSAAIKFSGGNPWKEIGAWTAQPALSSGTLSALSNLRSWIGLKNSDDQGTRFDLRAEVYKNSTLVASGESYCIQGVTRNANQAKEVTVAFNSPFPMTFNGTSDVLSLKISTRIGTNGAGVFCGGHSNAVGLRLYFDAVSRPSKFTATFSQ
jgi:uncharacterized repeat protein (TIGR03803 family)